MTNLIQRLIAISSIYENTVSNISISAYFKQYATKNTVSSIITRQNVNFRYHFRKYRINAVVYFETVEIWQKEEAERTEKRKYNNIVFSFLQNT